MSFAERMIELQYQNSINCAKELENVASVVKGVSTSDLEEIRNSLGSAWEGEAAVKCLQKVGLLQTGVKADGASIDRTAATIRQIAENVRRAERIAYEITHRRKY